MGKTRYLEQSILDDLGEKMVFVGGPRQVGKTTLGDNLSKRFKSAYYSWDKRTDRIKALRGEWPSDVELLVLDEFHKQGKWKSWIKGEYDTNKTRYKILFTGSARLDAYRRGGDSLMGRYHYYRLHPFSESELLSSRQQAAPGRELQFTGSKEAQDHFERLFKFGGFPEPLFKGREAALRRWHNERTERLFKEDVRDLTRIMDIGNMSLLADLLPERVGSILSVNSLSQDVQVNFRTAENWLQALEQFYYCFRVPPYSSKKILSVRKEKKLYLWDWSQVASDANKLENIVASHLLKYCHGLYDVHGWKAELFFLRDHSGREVDFLVALDGKPWFCVEVKLNDKAVSGNIHFYREKLGIPFCYQVVAAANHDTTTGGVRCLSVAKFLTAFV